MMTTSTVPAVDIDLYSPCILADPWPTLRYIQEQGPLVWNHKGYWMATSDRLCRRILSHPADIGQEGMIAAFFGEEAFIAIDDKTRHNALRNAIAPSFSHQAVQQLSEFVQQTAHDLLDQLVAEGDDDTVDLMAGLARPLPAYVIAHMMGVETAMIAKVVEWSDRMSEATAGGFPIDYDHDPYWLAAEQAKKDLATFLIAEFAHRRAHPGSDLISQMVHSNIGRCLSDDALVVNIRQLLFAGNETTAKWLGHIIQTLAAYPDVRQELSLNPVVLPAALEEVMRWQGVTQVLPKAVKKENVVLEGMALPKGAEILLLVGAAGRDPARWEAPDRFDIHRDPQPHLGFGMGLHSCLGAVLARMEALVVTKVLLSRFQDYEIRGPVTFGNFSLRGPAFLPAKL